MVTMMMVVVLMMTVVATSVEYQADNRSEHPAAFLLANISATLLPLPL